ncbi:beta strand repeat-containing protein [Pelovirga terrestris]|uniref:Calcium-binding protein n=1 Tax=Pelovirga terrestris TaxID=2771352 RepID=A0A8J6QZ75_9BACT|nr:hypothetical protein [Pelovirga terrestris]MBD1401913.1 hypothetical protein [Pelovirga terrestris]
MFTAPAHNSVSLVVGGDVPATTAAVVAGTAAVPKDESQNEVIYGNVSVDDHAVGVDSTIETIALDGYGNAAVGDVTDVDALKTLTLRNSDGSTVVNTDVATLSLVLDNMGDAATANVNLDGAGANVETLTITSENDESDVNLTAAAVKALTINAGADLDLSRSAVSTVLETVSITGAGEVDLGDITAATGLDSLNASANTGGVTATVNAATANVGDLTEYIFSGGDDDVTLADSTVNTKVSLGAGNDKISLATGTTSLSAVIDGGAGTNTLHMDAADAVNASATTTFETKIDNFQKLSLGASAVDHTVKLGNMNDIDYVISTGVVTTKTLTIQGMLNNGTLELTTAGSNDVIVEMADATGANDTFNIVTKVSATNLIFGKVEVADVENINIAATDTAPGTAASPNIQTATLTVDADSAETIVITGNSHLNLTTTTGTDLVLVDASAMTGKLDYAATVDELVVLGGSGADTLDASGASQVVLNGGAGNDTLIAGELAQLTGGAGADTFEMNVEGGVVGYATILDFNSGDVIDTGSNVGGTNFVTTKIAYAGTAVFQDVANKAITETALG